MNSSNANDTAVIVSELVQATYESYVSNLLAVSSLALCFYAALLVVAQETEYIWSKRFSLPALLYILTRYGYLILQALNLWLGLLPTLGSLCNILTDTGNALSLFVFIGVQGLLIARAYSLCEGNKIVICAIGVLFFCVLALTIYSRVAFSGCITSFTSQNALIDLLTNILNVLIDFIVFIVCMWKIWSTWRLKREVGIQGTNDLVSILLKQIVSRFFFVIFITITFTILSIIPSLTNDLAINALAVVQQTASSLLIASFTLDLRRQNSVAIEAMNVTLPTIQFQNVLQYVQQSVLVEMGVSREIEDMGEEQSASDLDDSLPSADDTNSTPNQDHVILI